jgi:predicted nucleic acid-binding protein
VIYLDSNIVIYLIEEPPDFGARATARMAPVRDTGERLAVTDLTRLECRVRPLASSDLGLLAHYDAFFRAPEVHVVPITSEVWDRATTIRAQFGHKVADAVHLAAAVQAGCGLFLTNDGSLDGFPGIPVEVLA